MGVVGRKPKPVALKLLAGNPGKRALNKNEPKAPAALPRCPQHIQGLARQRWHSVGRLLLSMGVFTEADKTALELYCVTYQRWVEAEAQVKELGSVVRGEKGNVVQNPYLAVATKAAQELRAILAEFGMTPSSRSRLSLPEAKAEDPFDSFLKQGKAANE